VAPLLGKTHSHRVTEVIGNPRFSIDGTTILNENHFDKSIPPLKPGEVDHVVHTVAAVINRLAESDGPRTTLSLPIEQV